MNSTIMLVFLLGLVVGAGLVTWLCWAEFHARIDGLERSLHERIAKIETGIVDNAAEAEAAVHNRLARIESAIAYHRAGDLQSLEGKALELCYKIERAGASDALTAASIAASELHRLIADLTGRASPSPSPDPTPAGTGIPPQAAPPATSAS